MKKQQGFTLIELIMVIVILGILSAFALPRFADLSGNARTSAIEGFAGAIRSSAAISHAQWLADDANATSVSLEGTTVQMVNGYPQAIDETTNNGILAAAQISTADFASVTFSDVDGDGDDETDAGGETVTLTLQTNCAVSYTSPTASASFDVTTTTSGCN